MVIISTYPYAPPDGYRAMLTGLEPKKKSNHRTTGAWVLCDNEGCGTVIWLIPSRQRTARNHYCIEACRVANMQKVYQASREAHRVNREAKAAANEEYRCKVQTLAYAPPPPVPTRCPKCGGLIHNRGEDLYGVDWSCYTCGYGGPTTRLLTKAEA